MKKTILFFSMALFAFTAHAQSIARQVVASGGASYSNTSGRICFTVGETVVTHLAASTAQLSQGFQQGIAVSGTALSSSGFSVAAYPNPATSFVKVSWSAQDVIISLYSVSGNLLLEQKVSDSDETMLDLSGLASGAYLLNVTGTDGTGTFRILKE